MKKLKYVFLTLGTFLIPNVVLATDYVVCGNNKRFPLVFASMFSTLITIIKIGVPIFLVIGGMISFLKVTFSSNVDEDLKKAKNKLINSIIAAFIVFFVVSIVNFVISFVIGSNNDITSCVKCFLDPNSCAHVDSSGVKICPGLMEDQDKYDDDCNLIQDYTAKEIVIGSESFYIISSNDSETKLFAKYNLLVGGVYSVDHEVAKLASSVQGYGLQSSTALGYNLNSSQRIGTLEFSTSAYWLDDSNNFLSSYTGSSTSHQVYDSNSNLYSYVESYKSVLESFGVQVKSIGIPTMDDYSEISHVLSHELLHSTSYWLNSAYINSGVNRVSYVSPNNISSLEFNESNYAGIRPVIIVNTANLDLE